ncbi:MAG: hypothetical protein DMG67_06145 [Acidobacteria bacterium]|nr:MAG: hypothetical protein DMG67_06145 [Acidobacteriota bacterium]
MLLPLLALSLQRFCAEASQIEAEFYAYAGYSMSHLFLKNMVLHCGSAFSRVRCAKTKSGEPRSVALCTLRQITRVRMGNRYDQTKNQGRLLEIVESAWIYFGAGEIPQAWDQRVS